MRRRGGERKERGRGEDDEEKEGKEKKKRRRKGSIKDEYDEIQWHVKKSGWNNTEIWKAKGKAMDTNTGESPGYQSQSL